MLFQTKDYARYLFMYVQKFILKYKHLKSTRKEAVKIPTTHFVR